MDDRKLETTRDTALRHVQRCTPACPSSTSCRFRHARRKLREGGKPCTHARAWYRRFVLEVERIYGCSAFAAAFDLLQAAADAALLDLLVDRCARRLAVSSAFIEEANEALRPGPAGRRSRPGVTKTDHRPEVNMLMRLMRRKNKLINTCRALRQDATDASSPEQPSLAEFMQGIMEIGGQDLHDSIKESNPDLPDDWCLPGQSRFIRPKNGG